MMFKNIKIYLFIITILIMFSGCSATTGIMATNTPKTLSSSNQKYIQKVRTIIDENFKKNLNKKDKFKTELQKIEFINTYLSTYAYKTDKQLYGKTEYWASPEEYMKNRAGDCEDLALAKYHLLIKNGIDESKLDFIKGRTSGGLHIVLRYKDTVNNLNLVLEHAYILDYEKYVGNLFVQNDEYGINTFMFYKRINRVIYFFI